MRARNQTPTIVLAAFVVLQALLHARGCGGGGTGERGSHCETTADCLPLLLCGDCEPPVAGSACCRPASGMMFDVIDGGKD